MGTSVNAAPTWRFGVFDLDARTGELRRSGTLVKLREQPARILLLLLEHAGEMVTREQLRQHLWPSDTFVDFDHSLNTAVMKLRDALGDSADKPLYIETIPKKGYRFIAPVTEGPRAKSLSEVDSLDPPTVIPQSAMAATGSTITEEVGAEVDIKRHFGRAFLAGLILVVLGILTAELLIHRAARKHDALGAASSQPAIEQRITSNPPDAPIESAAVSLDGKYIAFADPTGLYLRDIASGEVRPGPCRRVSVLLPIAGFRTACISW